jgi:hypothetical protein
MTQFILHEDSNNFPFTQLFNNNNKTFLRLNHIKM